MAQWGHQRTPSTMIDSGSLWRLRFADATTAKDARATLRVLRFIGSGGHEGFGLVTIDPVWATQRTLPEWKLPSSRKSEPLIPTGKSAIAEAAHALLLPPNAAEARKPLQQLAVWMRGVKNAEGVPEVIARCTAFSSRDKQYAWKTLAADKPLRQFLEHYWSGEHPDCDLIRFAIEALLIRLPIREDLR